MVHFANNKHDIRGLGLTVCQLFGCERSQIISYLTFYCVNSFLRLLSDALVQVEFGNCSWLIVDNLLDSIRTFLFPYINTGILQYRLISRPKQPTKPLIMDSSYLYNKQSKLIELFASQLPTSFQPSKWNVRQPYKQHSLFRNRTNFRKRLKRGCARLLFECRKD